MTNPFDQQEPQGAINLTQEVPQDSSNAMGEVEQPTYVDPAAEIPETMINGIKRGMFARAWHGEEKLWKVFWLYGVLAGILLSVIIGILLVPLLFAGLAVPFLSVLPTLITLPYNIWLWVSLWRCAPNVNAKIWGMVARALVVIAVLSTIYSIISAVTAPANDAPKHPMSVGSGVTTATAPDGTVSFKVQMPGDVGSTNNNVAPVPSDTLPMQVPVQHPAAGPTAPASSPTALPLTPAPAATAAVHPCEQRMIDYATQNGADAKAYVAQNQAYLAECKKAMEAGAK